MRVRILVAALALVAGCGGHSMKPRDAAADAAAEAAVDVSGDRTGEVMDDGAGDFADGGDAATDGSDSGDTARDASDSGVSANDALDSGPGTCRPPVPPNQYPSALTVRTIRDAASGLFADVDGDGLLDWVGWNVMPNPLAFSVFRNDGTGAFSPAAPRSPDVGVSPYLLSYAFGGLGDFDGDGRTDGVVLAVDDRSRTYSLAPYRGMPDGRWSRSTLRPFGVPPTPRP